MLLAAHLKNHGNNMQVNRDEKHLSYVREQQPGTLFNVIVVTSSDSLQLRTENIEKLADGSKQRKTRTHKHQI